MRKYPILVMMSVLFLVVMAIGVFSFSGLGTGNSTDPFQITNCSQLQEMSSNLTAFYRVMNNINCSETRTWNNGTGFIPVGTFSGTLEGGGYNITGIQIYKAGVGNNEAGLFGRTNGATLKNIHIKSINITAYSRIGGLVGYATSTSVINCSVTGRQQRSPGIAFGSGEVGGLLGIMDGTSSTINNSYSVFNITYASTYAGGLIGHTASGQHIIDNSFALGEVYCDSGGYYCGGLVGLFNFITNSVVNHSYSTGKLTCSNPNRCGGFLGNISYTSGDVYNSYWDTNTSGWTNTSGNKGVGKTTTQMKNQSTFVNWNFTSVWNICSDSYPNLRNQTGNCLCLPNWTCSQYGECQPENLSYCNAVTDPNGCGEIYLNNISEIPPLACQLCDPNWTCSGYGDCLQNNTQLCNNVTDPNNCNETYTGNFSEFTPGVCEYCEPDWTCVGYGLCLENDTQNCNQVFDLNECGSSYGGNFSEFTPGVCDFCTPNWDCSMFGDCENLTEICLSVSDLNTCNETFGGNLSDFDQSCQAEPNYVPTYKVGDIPNLVIDFFGSTFGAIIGIISLFILGLLIYLISKYWR